MKTTGLLAVACFYLLVVCSCARQSALPYSEASLQRYLTARKYYTEQRLEDALKLLLENHKSFPEFSANSFLLGKIYFFQNDYEQAECYWRHTLARNPHHIDTSKWLARLYLQLQKIDEAQVILAEALANSSEDAELLILMAKVKRHQQDLAGAIELYLKAKAFSERMSEASIDLAEIYYDFGLTDRAERELVRASTLLGEESSISTSVATTREQLESIATKEVAP